MRQIGKRWEIAALLVIVAVACAFRFHQLDGRGYIFPDERYYNSAGRSLLVALAQMDTTMSVSSQEREAKFEKAVALIGIVNQFFAKPLHTLLTALGLAIFDFRQCGDLYLFALLGVLSVVLVYIIGRTFWNVPVALLASLYMALSPFHISYSRSGLAQAGSLFFLILSLYFYLLRLSNDQRTASRLFISGLLLGLGITCHHLVAVFLMVYVIYELVLMLQRQSTFKKLVILICSLSIPLFFFEALFILGKIYTGDKVLSYSNSYFLASILQFLAATPHGGFHFADPSSGWSFPIKFLLASEGYISLLIIVIALVYLLINLRQENARQSYFLLLALCFPYVFWALVSTHGLVARVYSPLIPVLSIAVGIGIAGLDALVKKSGLKKLFLGRALVLAIACLLFAGLFVNARKCISYDSPYETIKDYLRTHNIDVVGTIGGWFFFEDIENVRAKTWSQALELYRQGRLRFFINDAMSMDPRALKEFLQVDQGVVVSTASAFNYIPYQFEGIPVEIRQIWREELPLQVDLIDIKQYLQAVKK